jgi:hypothetical protein
MHLPCGAAFAQLFPSKAPLLSAHLNAAASASLWSKGISGTKFQKLALVHTQGLNADGKVKGESEEGDADDGEADGDAAVVAFNATGMLLSALLIVTAQAVLNICAQFSIWFVLLIMRAVCG